MLPKMKISKQNKWLLFSFLALISFSLIYSMNKKDEAPKSPEKIYPDTYIPKGFVLIPIELVNYESVSALIDQFGVIDLYAGAPQMAGSMKIASHVKMLRAPLNPHLFAILVPETQSSEIMKKTGPFWAVVQNRASAGSISNPSVKPARTVQIEYYKGDK